MSQKKRLSVLRQALILVPNSGWNDSRSSTPPARGGFDGYRRNDRPPAFSGGGGGRRNDGWGSTGGGGGGGGGGYGSSRGGDGGARDLGLGHWRDGKHVPGARNMRLEKDLFGDPSDPSKQHTGINFEKYDDIPVEATGAGVPDPVTEFTHPPLDALLLENIRLARYTNPTPVQKYSIPIVAADRDLMACAQVSF